MRNTVGDGWKRGGTAASFLAIGVVVLYLGVVLVTLRAIAGAVSRRPIPPAEQAWDWVVLAAAALQLVLAASIGRLLVQPVAPRSRYAFDLLALAAAALAYGMGPDGAPFLLLSLVLAGFTLWLVLRVRERWLGPLTAVWAGSVVVVLASLLPGSPLAHAVAWTILMIAAVLTARGAMRLGGATPAAVLGDPAASPYAGDAR